MGGTRLSVDDARRKRLLREIKFTLDKRREPRRCNYMSAKQSPGSDQPAHSYYRPSSYAIEMEAAAQLENALKQARQQRDLHTLSRLSTAEGITAFMRQRRLKAYGTGLLNGVERSASGSSQDTPHTESMGVQTEPSAECEVVDEMAASSSSPKVQSPTATSNDLLARDEQSLEHLAEADLAYLEM
eukprot:5392558-Prymnesium_polylepis.1